MSYANLDGVPTQSEGTSEILASDWNTYVRDNFDALKFGHIVCTSGSRPAGVAEGTMIYESDTNLIYVHNGSSWSQNNLTPVGMIAPFAGSVEPDGWLLCNGQAVAQATYAALYAVIGGTYDVTSAGSGNFRVPDLQGRVVAGIDGTGVTDANAHPTRLRPVSADAASLGKVIGDLRLQAHTHTITDPGHSHSYQIGGTSLGITNSSDRPARANVGTSDPNFGGINGNTTGITGTNTHNQNQGSAQNVQPTMMLNYIIKY